MALDSYSYSKKWKKAYLYEDPDPPETKKRPPSTDGPHVSVKPFASSKLRFVVEETLSYEKPDASGEKYEWHTKKRVIFAGTISEVRDFLELKRDGYLDLGPEFEKWYSDR